MKYEEINMNLKTVLMDALAIDRALKRISHEIIENNGDLAQLLEKADLLYDKIQVLAK